MTAQELAAQHTKLAAEGVIRAARSTAEDKLDWKPLDEGRSVLDQLRECALANAYFAGAVNAQEKKPESWAEQLKGLTSLGEIADQVTETAAAVSRALIAIPDETAQNTITIQFGEPVEMNYMEYALIPERNMEYHRGQICYIQTLYGDKVNH